MSETTAIQWTDTTWSPVTGCTRVSEGCRHCYAEKLTATRLAHQPKYVGLAVMKNGESRWTNKVRLHEDELARPLRWRKPRRVFVCSMSDIFHPDVPFEFIDRVFATMGLCTRHTFQILTKRPERMEEYLNENDGLTTPLRIGEASGNVGADNDSVVGFRYSMNVEKDRYWPLANVWLGTSVEDQATADERIPHLLRCPAAVRFLSCEPLLGPIDLPSAVIKRRVGDPQPDWVIIGGESGPGARLFDVTWARDIVAQCRAAGVACFVKQLGSQPHDSTPERVAGMTIPRGRLCLRSSKGGDPAEWPADLRVREWPS